MWNYKGSKVVIVGLGVTGLSCVEFFLSRGIIPKVTDSHINPKKLYKLPYIVECCLGRLNDIWILSATLIVVSPGVRLDHPVFIEAIKLGIEIVGDIELFVREVSIPIIAITGSNGKSTVTRLIANIAQYAGWKVGVVGNIGVPVLNLLNKSYQLYILEISSFQLDTTYNLSAAAAVVLNISEDHMDRYPGGIQQYYLSKKKIYRNSKVCVINVLDSLMVSEVDNYENCVTIGINARYADYHVRYYKRKYWIVAYNKYLLDCSEMKINSTIYYTNVLVALALSDAVKIPRKASLVVLCQFSGLPHRCQLVCKNRNISWINDSKATNVNATKEAISHLSRLTDTLHLLLGGDGKQANFFPLKYLIKDQEIHLYCFGKDGLFLTELGYKKIILTNSLKEAMYIIYRCVKPKDIVLLSPACSSLDQFLSFEVRGFVFSNLVKELTR